MKQPLLYHTTSINNAYKILRGNCLNLSEKYNNISFSRNKHEKYGVIQFVFNRQALSYNYKITPYMDGAERATNTDSSEEIITRPITNVTRYLIGLDIIDDRNLRLLLRKLDRFTGYQLIHNVTERSTIALTHVYDLYTIVKTIGIPVGDRLAYLFNMMELKLN